MLVPSCSFYAIVVTIVIQHCSAAVLSCAKKKKKMRCLSDLEELTL